MQVCCVAPAPRAVTQHAAAALKLFADPAHAAQHEAAALLAAAAPAPPMPVPASGPGLPIAHCSAHASAMSPTQLASPRCEASAQSSKCGRDFGGSIISARQPDARPDAVVQDQYACLPIVQLLAVVVDRPLQDSEAAGALQQSRDTAQEVVAAQRGQHASAGGCGAASGHASLHSTPRSPESRIAGLLLEQFDMSLLDLLRVRCSSGAMSPEHSLCGSPSSAVCVSRLAGCPVGGGRACGSPSCMSDRSGGAAGSARVWEPLPEVDMLRVLCSVACAAEGLHRRGVLHMDIKAANVLVMVRPSSSLPMRRTRAIASLIRHRLGRC